MGAGQLSLVVRGTRLRALEHPHDQRENAPNQPAQLDRAGRPHQLCEVGTA
jgi:hypothetical protein